MVVIHIKRISIMAVHHHLSGMNAGLFFFYGWINASVYLNLFLDVSFYALQNLYSSPTHRSSLDCLSPGFLLSVRDFYSRFWTTSFVFLFLTFFLNNIVLFPIPQIDCVTIKSFDEPLSTV